MSDNYSTQANNFDTGLNSTVDPRTGLYTLNLPLLSLTANRQLGPALNLGLSYDPLSTTSSGFGTGFSLNLSRYDTATKQLFLSSGERYRVTQTAGQPLIRQKKLNNFIFKKQGDHWLIIWKNGVTEELRGGDSIKYPVKITAPSGHAITLSWQLTGAVPRLTHVRDATHTLMKVEYISTANTRVMLFPDSEQQSILILKMANGYLSSLSRDVIGSKSMKWQFRLQPVDNRQTITGLTYPTGLREEVIYRSKVMRFPNKSNLPSLPAVTNYRRYPGADQPVQETTWHWSDANYLGFGAAADWHPEDDYSYGITGNYNYSSTATQKSNDISLITTYTYNKFHLLAEEKSLRNGATTTRTTHYYANESAPFSKQPPQFLLPEKVTETLKAANGKKRTRSTLTKFDDQGNLLSQTTPDGTMTTLSWFPATGGDGCPPDTHGFVRFMQRKTVTFPQINGYDLPDETENYSYSKLGKTDCVVQTMKSVFSGTRLRHQQATSYCDTPGDAEFGRITILDDTYYPEGGDTGFTTRQTFTTNVSDEMMSQTTTVTTHDDLVTTRHRTINVLSGLLLKETDTQGVATTWQYDTAGRLLTRTDDYGTGYQQTTTWAYRIDGTPITEQTAPTGEKIITYFDGMGREIRRERTDIDGTQKKKAAYEVYRASYNKLGEKVSETRQDWHTNGDTPQAIRLTGDTLYGVWGDPVTVTLSDGQISAHDLNPVALTQTEQRSGTLPGRSAGTVLRSGTNTDYFDETSLQIIRSTRHNTDGTECGTVKHTRDGRGQLCKLEDALGNATTFTYDDNGRELSRMLPDGTIVSRRYASHLDGDYPVSISVTDTDAQGNIRTRQLGTQTFDSAGRLTSATNGGRTTCYTYKGACSRPATVTTPAGQVLTYTYIPELGDAVSSLTADGVTQTFRYDPLTGEMLSADEAENQLSFTLTPAGRLKEEITTLCATPRTAAYTYTLGGAVSTYRDISGSTTTYQQDTHGRLTTITDAALSVSIEYDALGRVCSRTTTESGSGATLKLTPEYDDFSREIARTLTDSRGGILTVTQTWLDNNLLAGRITRRDDILLTDERYEYDCRNRLTGYAVTGSRPPREAYGHPLTGQQYCYDALNNLTTVTSLLADNSEDTATFHYENEADPTQLTAVTHSHPAYPARINLEYDANGRMTLDEAGRTLTYDALGRLTGVHAAGSYGYDAMNRLVSQQVTAGDTRLLYYRDGERVNEIRTQRDTPLRLIRNGHDCLGVSGGADVTLTACDKHGSPQWSHRSAKAAGQVHAWSPYGSGEDDKAGGLPGFNGERPDPVSGCYHLGNGYRAYNPVLMRFTCPDNLSPFGAGGINPYVYCSGDPVNLTDPSGHMSTEGMLGIGMGILGLLLAVVSMGTSIAAAGGVMAAIGSASKVALVFGGLGIAADATAIASGAMTDSDPQTSATLGWVALGAGIIGIGTQSFIRAMPSKVAKGAAAAESSARVISANKLLDAGSIEIPRPKFQRNILASESFSSGSIRSRSSSYSAAIDDNSSVISLSGSARTYNSRLRAGLSKATQTENLSVLTPSQQPLQVSNRLNSNADVVIHSQPKTQAAPPAISNTGATSTSRDLFLEELKKKADEKSQRITQQIMDNTYFQTVG